MIRDGVGGSHDTITQLERRIEILNLATVAALVATVAAGNTVFDLHQAASTATPMYRHSETRYR
jgi:hypothetical protein